MEVGSTGLSAAPIFSLAGVRENPDQPVSDHALQDLLVVEQEIAKLREEILEEQQLVEVMHAQRVEFGFEGLSGDELGASKEMTEKIVALQQRLAGTLLKYPAVLRAYLDHRFNYDVPRESHEIFEHIVKIMTYMDVYCDQTMFILAGLEEIDRFLTNSVFTSPTEACPQKPTKIDLIVFQEFFTIIEKHYDVISQHNPKVALNLKIKLANLPLIDAVDRASFTKIYLDEWAQKMIMIDHFQEREDQAIAQAIQQLNSKKMTEKEAKRLTRDLSQNGRLSLPNKLKLIDALTPLIGVRNWDDAHQNLSALRSVFAVTSSGVNPSGLTSLYLACKAKHYFEMHDAVPRWYHSTDYKDLSPIITSNEIPMRGSVARFAWVSTQREPRMDACVFLFKHAIAQIDPDPFIAFEKGKNIKWRGLQKAIPLVASGKKGRVDANVVLVGLAPTYQKSHKVAIVQLLKGKGIVDPKVVPVELIDYMQREILLKIGCPNLSEKWWGRA